MPNFDFSPRNKNYYGSIQHWINHIRLWRLILSVVVIILSGLLVTHYYVSRIIPEEDPHFSRSLKEEDPRHTKYADLQFQIKELQTIRTSVNNELRDLESKRQKMLTEIGGYNSYIDNLKGEYEKYHWELEQLKLTIENTKLEKEELRLKNMPDVQAPAKILPSIDESQTETPPMSSSSCSMHKCFDYSRCSLTSHFPVYLYDPIDYQISASQVESFLKTSVTHAFHASPHLTYDPHIACLYIVLIGETQIDVVPNPADIKKKLYGLPHWRGDGRNHVLLSLSRSFNIKPILEQVNTGRAIVIQSAFTDFQFRDKFDMVIPPSLGISHGDVWDQLPNMVPSRRKYLISFLGDYYLLNNMQSGEKNKEGEGLSLINKRTFSNSPNSSPYKSAQQLISLENTVVDILKKMQTKFVQDGFLFEFSCENDRILGLHGEWAVCGSEARRHDILKQSTFSLIMAPTNFSYISSVHTQVRIYEALKLGAVPVILGDHIKLPFDELLLWKEASLAVPKARITELHYYLRSFSDNDVLAMRQRGRHFWETYFGTTKSIIDTMLATIRTRLNIPPYTIHSEPSPSVFNETFAPLTEPFNPDPQAESDDMLGPIEPPLASPKYRRNFTFTSQTFNVPGDPFHLYPYTPWEPVLPAEAKFLGSGVGFRPIGKGAGGAGKEFNEALGGNFPREQFTIVMLTYEREAVLINALQTLKGLPHLNKIIVVWNSPRPPSDDLVWPDIGVTIHVVRTSKNSLNNRFLPYDAIETECILSIDDDAHLRHDEIMFGFRVWREARDRIVGFPGRFHAWNLDNDGWLYNSNYSCELSMVLTGAAFFHKYYAYLYSYVMPQAIRDKVDEYINCEDLAMNFLVSHITRKPPIKVTSRWTFRCPGCPKALSVEESHFNERHKCINYFVKVYGYMPLLYTQFRVDSVLFKTRIPHDKQKCFKYI